mgnify:CR=1 FL=1
MDSRQTLQNTPPKEIRLKKDRSHLVISYEDNTHYDLAAEYLRVESPSAEVQGHGVGQKTIPQGKKNVKIIDIQPVGHYAVRLIFSDGHDTGLYSWSYLRRLGEETDQRFQLYLETLDAKGLSRE